MVLSQKQLDIANKSYTNKDFPAIYNELLGYAEKLSYRFSPITANESDPFIVMLKLAAFVADKVNYNVDKNILERFMLSCTQETSMQELTSMMGYRMHFYKAAETQVVFNYDFADIDESSSSESAGKADKQYFKINGLRVPKYSTLSNTYGAQFVTLEDAVISRKSLESIPVKVIQGKIKDLTILGSNKIQLENLDVDNKVYFPEYQVAENGVIITSDVSDEWIRVDNLNEQQYLSLCYYFGYDSKRDLPYLQFPSWISQIIGSGLEIRYIVTQGESGNISAKSLTTVTRISKPETQTNQDITEIDDARISVINYSATTNGADPETISESYSGFKKIVGTFDTLITCRDYASKIYYMIDPMNQDNLVSNAIVSDRRSDLNYSTRVVTVDDYGRRLKTFPGKNFKAADAEVEAEQEKISAFDLCVYPFKPIKTYSYLAIDNYNGYNDCYNIVDQGTRSTIEALLEDEKTMSHDYKKFANSDIVAIKNYMTLTAIITTVAKVSLVEELEILANVKNALIRDYNMRTLTFGQDIPFESLLATIENSDVRIKNVSLREPDLDIRVALAEKARVDDTQSTSSRVTKKQKEISLDNRLMDLSKAEVKESLNSDEILAQTTYQFILAKNVLSGRVSIFDYNEDFEYDYDHMNCEVYDQCGWISTFANIHIDKQNDTWSYTLKDNEVVQFIAPKLKTETTYPYGVLYNLVLGSDHTDYIPANSEYTLQNDDKLIFAWMDNSNVWQYETYTNTRTDKVRIVNPNFNMYTNTYRKDILGQTPTKIFENIAGQVPFGDYYQLGAQEEVKCKKILSDKYDKSCYCFWVTNNPENKIDWVEVVDKIDESKSKIHYEYLLRDDESFFVADQRFEHLYEYGSGSKLYLTYNDSAYSRIWEDWKHDSTIDTQEISEKGLTALRDIFKAKSFDEHNFIEIYMNEIKTLVTGDALDFVPSNRADSNFEDIIYYAKETITETSDGVESTIDSARSMSARAIINFSTKEPASDSDEEANILKLPNNQFDSIRNMLGCTYYYHFDLYDSKAYIMTSSVQINEAAAQSLVEACNTYFYEEIADGNEYEQFIIARAKNEAAFYTVNTSGSVTRYYIYILLSKHMLDYIKNSKNNLGNVDLPLPGYIKDDEYISYSSDAFEYVIAKDDSGNSIYSTLIYKPDKSQEFKSVQPNIFYTYDKDTDEEIIETLPDRSTCEALYDWNIRALLDINCGPDTTQTLVGKQSITIYICNSEYYTADQYKDLKLDTETNPNIIFESEADKNKPPVSFKCDQELIMGGGEKLPLFYLNDSLDYNSSKFLKFSTDDLTQNWLSRFYNEFYEVQLQDIAEHYDENKTKVRDAIKFHIADINYKDESVVASNNSEEDISLMFAIKLPDTMTIYSYPDSDKNKYEEKIINLNDSLNIKNREGEVIGKGIYLEFFDENGEEVTVESDFKSPTRLFFEKINDDENTQVKLANNLDLMTGLNIIWIKKDDLKKVKYFTINIGYSPVDPNLYKVEGYEFNEDTVGVEADEVSENLFAADAELADNIDLPLVNPELNIRVSKPKYIKGLNPLLGLKIDENLSDSSNDKSADGKISVLLSNLGLQFDNNLDILNRFFWICETDSDRELALSKAYDLSSPEAIMDPNNIANAWAIPIIDFKNSDIYIHRGSKR